MNKSLVLRNKIYRFCFLLFSFFLFIYLCHFLINGERGIFAYYKIANIHSLKSEDLILLNNKNKELEEKISRLSPNTLDLDYLDEELIINTGRTHKNELIIKFDN